MDNYCCDCEYLNRNNEYKDWFTGETKYKCTKKGEYVKVSSHVCSNYSPKKSNSGSYVPGGCYITTIVSNILGYEDNCEVLTTLRNFRDNYLKKNEKYIPLLIQYDVIGPKIANEIVNEEHAAKHAGLLLKYFLIPCVNEIKNNNYEAAINIYINLVNHLKCTYNLEDEKIDISKDYNIAILGKGRTKK